MTPAVPVARETCQRSVDVDQEAVKRKMGPGNLLTWVVAISLLITYVVPDKDDHYFIDYDELIDEIGYPVSPRDFAVGPCKIRTEFSCPNPEVTFHLFYNGSDGVDSRKILVNDTWSNLDDLDFHPRLPTKIIVHGFNADMNLDSLVNIRLAYLDGLELEANVVAMDWRNLSRGPCYLAAVLNVPHASKCLAQLINRIRDTGALDIHLIGFSLGAHVPAYAANVLRPYKLPRITGLDPAMPLFVTNDKDKKLDATDAEFVDIYHTNSLLQGKVEVMGHVDFYFNSGIVQPGCWTAPENFVSCSHNRAPLYFAESINTDKGFYGWKCSGLFHYLIGLCPQNNTVLRILAGEWVDSKATGVYIVKTKSESPFALGDWGNSSTETVVDRSEDMTSFRVVAVDVG